MRNQTTSVSIHDLQVDDVVIPDTAIYQEWPVKNVERRGNTRITWRITWENGTTTTHGSRAMFRVKV